MKKYPHECIVSEMFPYTEDVSCAIMAGIPVKFGTAHGRLRPEVGSTKRIDVYGSGGFTQAPQIFVTFDQNTITLTDLLGSKYNFYSLTVCRLDQYLPHSSEKISLLP